MDIEIKQFVYRVRRRLREQCVIDNLIRFVCKGMLVATVIMLVSLWIPFYYAIPIASFVSVLSFLAGLVAGIVRTPTPMQAALIIDAKGYQEKISTAFYLQGKEDLFSQLQKKDAQKIVKEFCVRKEFPIRLEWKRIGVLLCMLSVFLISALLDTPAKQKAVVEHEVKKEVKEQIARLEKVEKKLEQKSIDNQNEIANMKKQFEEAKKELKESKDYEELTRTKERINKKLEMATKEVKDRSLREIVQQMTQEANQLAHEEKSKLAEEARKALDKAANGDDKDKENAYQALTKLAQATGSGALKEAAQAYKKASYSDDAYANATQSLKQLSDNINASDYAQNNDNNGQNSGSQNASQNSSQENNGKNNMQGNSAGNTGNTSGNGSGSGSETGSGNGSGTGSGSGSGKGSGSGSGKGSGNGSGSGWNYGGKEGQEGERKTNENITIPDGKLGNDENLTGKANGNDSATKTSSNQSKTWSGNKVSYDEVSGEYKDKAYKKVDGSNYPSKMKDKIRKYFDGLN